MYPSAIRDFCDDQGGLPTGPAMRLRDLSTWQSKRYCILTVNISKVNKIQQMPVIEHRSDKGSIDYKNEAPGEVIIDKYTLEEYIRMHEIEYEIIDGIYWDGEGNTIIGGLMTELYSERSRIKKISPRDGPSY
jgi:hypothetical protein